MNCKTRCPGGLEGHACALALARGPWAPLRDRLPGQRVCVNEPGSEPELPLIGRRGPGVRPIEFQGLNSRGVTEACLGPIGLQLSRSC